jgi:transposase
VDTVGGSKNRKRRPNYPAHFKHRLATAPREQSVSISKLATEFEINTNMLFKRRSDLRADLLVQSGPQSAQLLSVAVQHNAVQSTLPSSTMPARHIEIIVADAVIRVSTRTDAWLLRLVLQILRTRSICLLEQGSGLLPTSPICVLG